MDAMGGGSWEPHRGIRHGWDGVWPGMPGSTTDTAEDRVTGERCPLVWRDDKTTWDQPSPGAGTLVSVAEDCSLCGCFPNLGAQAPKSRHGQVDGQGGWGCRDGASSQQALPALSAQHGLLGLRTILIQPLTGDSSTWA